MGFMVLAGLIAGTAGTSGGFVKTPATSELMHVPTKVAAATTTFTIGVTAASALAVFAVQGRIDTRASSAVIVGSLAGAVAGARLQALDNAGESNSRTPAPTGVSGTPARQALPARRPDRARSPAGPGRTRVGGHMTVSGITGRRQGPWLRAVTRTAALLGLAGALLPGSVGAAAAVATVGLVMGVPLLRVAWLVLRLGQERDTRFVVTGIALLTAVAAGMTVSLMIRG